MAGRALAKAGILWRRNDETATFRKLNRRKSLPPHLDLHPQHPPEEAGRHLYDPIKFPLRYNPLINGLILTSTRGFTIIGPSF